jgi:hypothetical protein
MHIVNYYKKIRNLQYIIRCKQLRRPGIIAILIYFFTIPAFAQTSADSLSWNKNRKLLWSDFMGRPERSPIIGARTYTSIKYKLYYNRTNFKTSVSCTFVKKMSWRQVKGCTDYSLNHEQRHFDISEIYARKLRNAFADYEFHKRSVSRDIDAIFKKVCAEKDSVNSLYDKETLHSLDKEKQAEWDKKLDIWLYLDEKLATE